MLGVVLPEHLGGRGEDAQGDQAVALALDPAQDFTGEAAGESVGLDQDQGTFDSHAASLGR